MQSIFISYRRSDSRDTTARIYELLSTHFGRDHVFFDIDSIPLGVDFKAYLSDYFRRCGVVLVMIGEIWANDKFRSGPYRGIKRLYHTNDFVRLEIELGLQFQLPIIPVLIGDAVLPTAQNLPRTIRKLCKYQAITIHSGQSFHDDTRRLIRGIENIVRFKSKVHDCEKILADSQNTPVRNELTLLQIEDKTLNPYSTFVNDAIAEFEERSTVTNLAIGRIESTSELEILWHIDQLAYRESNIEYRVFVNWWKSYSDGLRVLKSKNRILGAIGIWPIGEVWAQRFFDGKVGEKSLSCLQLKQFCNRQSSIWYISGIVLLPELRGSKSFIHLLAGGLSDWLKSSRIQFPIVLCALAYSRQGESLLERFFFERQVNGKSLIDGFPLYRLRLYSRQAVIELLSQHGLEVRL